MSRVLTLESLDLNVHADFFEVEEPGFRVYDHFCGATLLQSLMNSVVNTQHEFCKELGIHQNSCLNQRFVVLAPICQS